MPRCARIRRKTPAARRWLHGTLGLALVGWALLTPVRAQSVATVPTPRPEAHSEAVEKARQQIQEWMAEKNLPSISIAVGLNGGILWAEGFGFADLEQRVPATTLTRYRIGSVSKPLAATAVARLHERGRLDLDAPVQKFVPSFPEKPWPVTTRQLLTHTSGIRHYRSEQEVLSALHYDDVLATLDVFAGDDLLFEPGTKFGYSTFAWCLASAVVESASGEPFLDFMRREVFAPAGMRHTVADDVFGIVPSRARFYDRGPDGRLRNASFVDQSNKWAGGGFLSTPSDLVRFAFAMMDGKLLESETVEQVWTPQRLASGEPIEQGLGWSIKKTGPWTVIGHGGSSVGGRTSFMTLPEHRFALAICTNVSGGEVLPVAMILMRNFAPKPSPAPAKK